MHMSTKNATIGRFGYSLSPTDTASPTWRNHEPPAWWANRWSSSDTVPLAVLRYAGFSLPIVSTIACSADSVGHDKRAAALPAAERRADF
jgi:hypothetical protein